MISFLTTAGLNFGWLFVRRITIYFEELTRDGTFVYATTTFDIAM